jgi:hypothetical protein
MAGQGGPRNCGHDPDCGSSQRQGLALWQMSDRPPEHLHDKAQAKVSMSDMEMVTQGLQSLQLASDEPIPLARTIRWQ